MDDPGAAGMGREGEGEGGREDGRGGGGEGGMTLRVLVPSLGVEHAVSVTPGTLVEAVKGSVLTRLEARASGEGGGWDAGSVRLIYKGRILADGQPMRDLAIEDGHTVHLTGLVGLRGRAGGGGEAAGVAGGGGLDDGGGARFSGMAASEDVGALDFDPRDFFEDEREALLNGFLPTGVGGGGRGGGGGDGVARGVATGMLDPRNPLQDLLALLSRAEEQARSLAERRENVDSADPQTAALHREDAPVSALPSPLLLPPSLASAAAVAAADVRNAATLASRGRRARTAAADGGSLPMLAPGSASALASIDPSRESWGEFWAGFISGFALGGIMLLCALERRVPSRVRMGMLTGVSAHVLLALSTSSKAASPSHATADGEYHRLFLAPQENRGGSGGHG